MEEPNTVPAKRSSAHVVEPTILPICKTATASQSSAGGGKFAKVQVVEPTIIPISLTSAPSQPGIPAAASSARLAPAEQPSPEALAPGMPKAAGQPPMPTAEVLHPKSFELKAGEAVFQNHLYKLTHEGDKWIRRRPLSADEILQIVNAPAHPTRQLNVTVYTKILQEWQEKNFPGCPELVSAIVECLEAKKLR